MRTKLYVVVPRVSNDAVDEVKLDAPKVLLACDSALDARRGREGVSLLLRVNHNNAEGRETRMRC